MAWMIDGVTEEKKKEVMKKYPKIGDLYTEAPKVNFQVQKRMSDISTKRDDHFEKTQSCVGTALSALGAGISMIMDTPADGVDQETLLMYLCDAGKLLTDVFHQQTIARKSFITPLMNKEMKTTLDATKADEWLYGKDFVEQVKEAKSVDKACDVLKNDGKSTNSKSYTQRSRDQGNSKYPPVKQRQVGSYYKKPTLKFKNKNQNQSQHKSRASTRMRSQSSTK